MRAVVVTGTRRIGPQDEKGIRVVFAALGRFQPRVVIHGDAAGIDQCAGVWGYNTGTAVIPVPAQWDELGKRAGPARNSAMLDMLEILDNHGYETKVLGFPDSESRGTWHCIREAGKRGFDVEVHEL